MKLFSYFSVRWHRLCSERIQIELLHGHFILVFDHESYIYTYTFRVKGVFVRFQIHFVSKGFHSSGNETIKVVQAVFELEEIVVLKTYHWNEQRTLIVLSLSVPCKLH